MDMKVNVVYEVKENDSWRGEEGLKIVSNIAKDETVNCSIAKSLVEHIKKESVMLEPDKLLLGFAEAQKRGIQDNLEALEDFELTAKNRADKVQEKLLRSYEDAENKYNELKKKFCEIQDKFCNNIISSREKVDEQVKYLTTIHEKLDSIDNFNLEKLSKTLELVISLVEKDADIVKLVLEKNYNEKKNI